MMRCFLCLGSNVGRREDHIARALSLLNDRGLKITRSSRLYETKPVEVNDEQENYLNMVVEGSFGGGAFDLLDICREVERSLGRTRPYRHAPRTMDIDILLIEGIEIMDEHLTVPHPLMEERAFVLYPLAEIAPDLILPSGRTASDVKNGMKDDELVVILDR